MSYESDTPIGDSDLDSDLTVGDSDLDSDLPAGDSTTTLYANVQNNDRKHGGDKSHINS